MNTGLKTNGLNVARKLAMSVALASTAVGVAAQQSDTVIRKSATTRLQDGNCVLNPDRLDASGMPRVLSPDEQAATVLLTRIRTDTDVLPKGASAYDLEAAIVYVVSQSGASRNVIATALNGLRACGYGQGNFRSALDRVRFELLNNRVMRGTAALSTGGGINQSTFSAPGVSLGGGSSNYTR